MQQGTCKHFTGAFHETHCRAGVSYRDVVPEPDQRLGWALRLPCHTEPYPNATPAQMEQYHHRGKCEKYEEPTAADLAEDKRQTDEMVARHMKATDVIAKVKTEHKDQDWQGVETCPVCGGKLHMKHAAFNGHVWGKCETADCLSWLE